MGGGAVPFAAVPRLTCIEYQQLGHDQMHVNGHIIPTWKRANNIEAIFVPRRTDRGYVTPFRDGRASREGQSVLLWPTYSPWKWQSEWGTQQRSRDDAAKQETATGNGRKWEQSCWRKTKKWTQYQLEDYNTRVVWKVSDLNTKIAVLVNKS